MTILHLDFETRSVLDLHTVGLDNYSRHPSTRVLMLGWAFDDDPVDLWQPHVAPELPKEVGKAFDSDVTLAAWNTPFERTIFHRCLGKWLDYDRWLDSMIWARHLSLPGYLEDAGAALGLNFDELKIDNKEEIKVKGRRKVVDVLINMFCEPFSNGGEATLFGVTEPEFHDWNDRPEEWKRFGVYCRQDVVAERAVHKILKKIPLPESERKIWVLDQKINEFGIPVNTKFVENSLALAARSKAELLATIQQKTGVLNPNSNPQILEWLKTQGYGYNSLEKGIVKAALDDTESSLTPLARDVLTTRKEAAKSSYKKLEKIKAVVGPDSRLRYQFAFLGASRSGRWSGSGVQVQNLPRPTKEVENNYDRAVEIITAQDYEAAKKEFSSVIGMATSCIRSVFQAPEGKEFDICDLSAIENRVLGWLSGCDDILKVFRDGLDPYVAFAVKMYRRPYDELKKDKAKRQIAKPAVLGAGYGLGGGEEKENKDGDIVKEGLWGYAENMGVKMTRDEAHLAVKVFRESYPEVSGRDGLWRRLERAAVQVIEHGETVKVGPLVFSRRKRENGTILMRIELPSGRGLHYVNARTELRIRTGKDGEPYSSNSIVYDGIGHGKGKRQDGWGPVDTYGGKLTENIVQAISRDVLTNGMLLADGLGAQINLHVHDELVTERDQDDAFGFDLADLQRCMRTPPSWAPDLLLDAEGFSGKIYKK